MKTAQEYIQEYKESKEEKIIPIAEFTTRTGKNTLCIIKQNNQYYFQTSNGYKSTQYRSLQEGIIDIIDVWGNYKEFRLLEQEE
jgi:hypothetical protein